MAKFIVALVLAAILLSSASCVLAASGTATRSFTFPYAPSSCYVFEDKGVMIASASDAIWDNYRAACGRRYSVTCTGPTNQGEPQPCKGTSVVVTVVDYCVACQGTIDLSDEAFSTIADFNIAREINIDYTQV